MKTLRPWLAADEARVNGLRREVTLARKGVHPSVCRVFDLHVHAPDDDASRVVFLTMEVVSGETLGARVRRGGALPQEESARIACAMASALDAVHAAGIVHRDFKSDNVMLVPVGDGSSRAVLNGLWPGAHGEPGVRSADVARGDAAHLALGESAAIAEEARASEAQAYVGQVKAELVFETGDLASPPLRRFTQPTVAQLAFEEGNFEAAAAFAIAARDEHAAKGDASCAALADTLAREALAAGHRPEEASAALARASNAAERSGDAPIATRVALARCRASRRRRRAAQRRRCARSRRMRAARA